MLPFRRLCRNGGKLNLNMKLKTIRKNFFSEFEKIKDLDSLIVLKKKYLGKKGEIRRLLSFLKDLNNNQKAKMGKEINSLKKEIEEKTRKKERELKNKIIESRLKKEKIDVSRPGRKQEKGSLHPLTLVQREVEDIFKSMGFFIAQGPEIEDEWHNFDALNIPQEHPARDVQDTLWLKKDKLLMRTHTSPVQIRYLEKNNPPLRVIVPGKVFRNERTDASHESQFYQCEGLMIDENISLAHLKAVIEEFLKRFFLKDFKTRLRPSYFPFTEPSVEFDVSCLNCGGKGCSVCGRTGWLEVIPGGMIHPNVFKAVGLNPKKWRGFAFGMGLDRLAMLKYRIDDIRLFHSGDLRFLNQF